jgi:hypothetical protein
MRPTKAAFLIPLRPHQQDSEGKFKIMAVVIE